jgi:Flp pilus assembly pilin Flp
MSCFEHNSVMEGAMFGVFIQILKNEDGFTAIEYGLIAAMILVFASQLVSQL